MKLSQIFSRCNSVLLESPISDLKAKYKKNGVEFTEELQQAFANYRELKNKEAVKPHLFGDNPQGFIEAINNAKEEESSKQQAKKFAADTSKMYVCFHHGKDFDVYAINNARTNISASFTIGRTTKEEDGIGEATHLSGRQTAKGQLEALKNDPKFRRPAWCIASQSHGENFWKQYGLYRGDFCKAFLFVSKKYQNWRFQVVLNDDGSLCEVRDPWQAGGTNNLIRMGLEMLLTAFNLSKSEFNAIIKKGVTSEEVINQRKHLANIERVAAEFYHEICKSIISKGSNLSVQEIWEKVKKNPFVISSDLATDAVIKKFYPDAEFTISKAFDSVFGQTWLYTVQSLLSPPRHIFEGLYIALPEVGVDEVQMLKQKGCVVGNRKSPELLSYAILANKRDIAGYLVESQGYEYDWENESTNDPRSPYRLMYTLFNKMKSKEDEEFQSTLEWLKNLLKTDFGKAKNEIFKAEPRHWDGDDPEPFKRWVSRVSALGCDFMTPVKLYNYTPPVINVFGKPKYSLKQSFNKLKEVPYICEFIYGLQGGHISIIQDTNSCFYDVLNAAVKQGYTIKSFKKGEQENLCAAMFTFVNNNSSYNSAIGEEEVYKSIANVLNHPFFAPVKSNQKLIKVVIEKLWHYTDKADTCNYTYLACVSIMPKEICKLFAQCFGKECLNQRLSLGKSRYWWYDEEVKGTVADIGLQVAASREVIEDAHSMSARIKQVLFLIDEFGLKYDTKYLKEYLDAFYMKKNSRGQIPFDAFWDVCYENNDSVSEKNMIRILDIAEERGIDISEYQKAAGL